MSFLLGNLKADMDAHAKRRAEREYRTVDCETCRGEGRIWLGNGPDERDCGQCDDCFGTGRAEIEVEPITADDEPEKNQDQL